MILWLVGCRKVVRRWDSPVANWENLLLHIFWIYFRVINSNGSLYLTSLMPVLCHVASIIQNGLASFTLTYCTSQIPGADEPLLSKVDCVSIQISKINMWQTSYFVTKPSPRALFLIPSSCCNLTLYGGLPIIIFYALFLYTCRSIIVNI